MITRLSHRLCSILIGGTLLLSSTVEANAPARDGITLQSTRVIYPEEIHKGITFKIQNDTAQSYLIQSRMSHAVAGQGVNTDTKVVAGNAPFIVLPPLKRLAPGEPLTLTIRQTKNTLPTDRESVFALQIKAIPAQSEHSETPLPGETRIALALQNTLKLFYRPQGLPIYDIKQIADSLRFNRQGDNLEVINPGPYYVTFKSLSVGSTPIDSQALFEMVPPNGKVNYPLSAKTSGELRWELINDYGYASDTYRRPLP